MDRLREIFLYAVAALALFALLGAVYQAMNRQLGSAATLGAIFLVGALIVFIPQLEVLKAWGIEARLTKTLDRAEEIIGRLRRLSAISAKATYMQMTWGNRMAAPPAAEKQAILDEIDQQLADLNVSPEERSAITRPFVQMIGFDLYLIFNQVLQKYAAEKNAALIQRVNSSQKEEDRGAIQSHGSTITAWTKRIEGKSPFEMLATYKFEDELERIMPRADEWLNQKELETARSFKEELVALFKDCEKKGGYTPAAAAFNQAYRDDLGARAKAKELFKDSLVDIR
jgi:hypothetical protein